MYWILYNTGLHRVKLFHVTHTHTQLMFKYTYTQRIVVHLLTVGQGVCKAAEQMVMINSRYLYIKCLKSGKH